MATKNIRNLVPVLLDNLIWFLLLGTFGFSRC